MKRLKIALFTLYRIIPEGYNNPKLGKDNGNDKKGLSG